jgi:hypothetical protein
LIGVHEIKAGSSLLYKFIVGGLRTITRHWFSYLQRPASDKKVTLTNINVTDLFVKNYCLRALNNRKLIAEINIINVAGVEAITGTCFIDISDILSPVSPFVVISNGELPPGALALPQENEPAHQLKSTKFVCPTRLILKSNGPLKLQTQPLGVAEKSLKPKVPLPAAALDTVIEKSKIPSASGVTLARLIAEFGNIVSSKVIVPFASAVPLPYIKSKVIGAACRDAETNIKTPDRLDIIFFIIVNP